jgi:4-aminobutyrate aminotransferase-like enzyme
VRGKGLFIGIELVKDRKTKEPAKESAAKFLQEVWKRRVLVGLGGLDGNVIRIEPPLVIKKENIDRAIEVFDEALKVVGK